MATVSFLVHPERPDALALARDTAGWLTERGDEARILSFSGPDRVAEAGADADLADVDLTGTAPASPGDAGTGIMGAMPSPLTGPAGNVEFLLHARKGAPGLAMDEVAALIAAAVSEAGHPSPPDPAG